MNKCGTCRHRNLEGYCRSSKIKEGGDREDPVANADSLVYSYPEGGRFWVGDNFGCVHHKGKIEFCGITVNSVERQKPTCDYDCVRVEIEAEGKVATADIWYGGVAKLCNRTRRRAEAAYQTAKSVRKAALSIGVDLMDFPAGSCAELTSAVDMEFGPP